MNALPSSPPRVLRWLGCYLILLLLAQAACWWQLRDKQPPLDIVSPPPGKMSVDAMALGEGQVFYRLLGMEVQTAGDLFGRFTALFHYDYRRLYGWFVLLDEMDSRSNYIPTLASFYFSQTQYRPDTRYIVNYLRQHAERDMSTKWWWMVQAIYLANHRLGDMDLALDMAKEIEGRRDLPLWVQQIPAFIYEQRGEMDAAMAIMDEIQTNAKNIPKSELRFMEYFVKERGQALDRKISRRQIDDEDLYSEDSEKTEENE